MLVIAKQLTDTRRQAIYSAKRRSVSAFFLHRFTNLAARRSSALQARNYVITASPNSKSPHFLSRAPDLQCRNVPTTERQRSHCAVHLRQPPTHIALGFWRSPFPYSPLSLPIWDHFCSLAAPPFAAPSLAHPPPRSASDPGRSHRVGAGSDARRPPIALQQAKGLRRARS